MAKGCVWPRGLPWSGGPTVALSWDPAEIEKMDDQPQQEMELLRCMPPAKKLAVMTALIREAFRLKAAWIRMLEPELSREEVQARVRDWIGNDRS